MDPSQKIAVGIFLAVLAGLYGSAGLMTLGGIRRAFARRRGAAPPPHSRAYVWLRRVVVGVAVAGIGCMVYGRFIEPRWLQVSRVRVESRHLTGATRPVRIAQISDTHCETYAGLEEELPDAIAALSPDVIVFTGDSLNSRAAAPRFRRLMTRLAKIAPTLAVKGNWDTVQYKDMDLFGGTGVRELNGEAVKLHIAGADVWFAGAPMYDKAKFAAALAALPTDACTVFLFHHPDAAIKVAEHGGVDLQLSGHTHGGQVALPFRGALITMSKYGNRFERGLCKVGQMYVYVNRGIGMEGNVAPRVRFGSRPEVTLIELAPEATPAASAPADR